MERNRRGTVSQKSNWLWREIRPLTLIAALAGFFASPVLADGTITLQYDDGYGVSGELLEFDGEMFRLRSSVGVISIPADDVFCIGEDCPLGTALRAEGENGEAKLTSVDGSTQIIGTILDFQGQYYLVQTGLGQMQVDAALVFCDGDGCVENPFTFQFGGDVTISNDAISVNGTLLGIAEGAYIVDSPLLGELVMSLADFDCSGEGCPP